MPEIIKAAPPEMIPELDRQFEERKAHILQTESEWTVGNNGTVYYIAADGDDANAGTSPDAPLKTFEKINTEGFLKEGDVVLMRRGDRFHERITTMPYVTYSAYGEGDKPMICGSIEANKASDWVPYKKPHIYKYTGYIGPNSGPNVDGFYPIEHDVGNIVFNDGEYFGSRVLKYPDEVKSVNVGNFGLTSNGKDYWHRFEEEFHGGEDLGHDLEFYFDFVTSELFVCSVYGNPGERFERVELCMKGNVIRGNSGVTLDNLSMRYGGSHGMGAGTCKDLVIKNCEVKWIGGAIQFIHGYRHITRFGNAIEIYGGCDNYQIYNNYICQIFDCGPTVQWQGPLEEGQIILERDIAIHDNAIERCDSPMEVWLTTPDCTET